MPDRLPIIYWDTCIFLEYLRDEAVTPPKKRAILRTLATNYEHGNRIITSTLTHAEALPRKITINDAAKEEEYWSFFNGIFFLDVEVSRQIIALAREIRDFYFREGDLKTSEPHRMVGLADAIHLATAIIAGADEFHTRDKKTRGGNLGILKTLSADGSGKVAGRWPLNIIDPEDLQGNILDPLEGTIRSPSR